MKLEIELSDVLTGLSEEHLEKLLSLNLSAAIMVIDVTNFHIELIAVPSNDEPNERLNINYQTIVTVHEKMGESVAKVAVANLVERLTKAERN